MDQEHNAGVSEQDYWKVLGSVVKEYCVCGSMLVAGEGDAEPAYIVGFCMTEDSDASLSG